MSKFIGKLTLSILKSALVLIFMCGIFSFGSFVLLAVDWNKYLVCLLALSFTLIFGLLLFMLGKSTGDTEYKNKILNDTRRRVGEISKANKYVKKDKEFLVYKGFLIGVAATLPLIILYLIRFIPGSSTWVDAFIKLGYAVFSTPVLTLNNGVSIFWFLFIIPVFSAVTGFGYIMGARKLENQQKSIKKELKSIYGEEIDV